MLISLYSLLLALSLTLASPWWLYRMLTSGRYRAGLFQRLGRVPPALRAAAAGRQVIWLHAVSVGEFLAAQRLIHDLREHLGPAWLIAVSTTTATAQQLAQERLTTPPQPLSSSREAGGPASPLSSSREAEGPASPLSSFAEGGGPASPLSSFAEGGGPASPLSSFAEGGGPASALSSFRAAGGSAVPHHLFFYPLDFRFAVRPYLRALKPRLVILMESELWPRLLHECAAARIPVAVANARVSDRSFRRTYPFRSLWLRMARHVTLFLAQSQETATRLEQLGIPPTRIQTPGNLKYDLVPPPERPILAVIRRITNGNKLLIAGSTIPGEEALLIAAWGQLRAMHPQTSLIVAPRHPGRAPEIERLLRTLAHDIQIAIASEPSFEDGEFDGPGLIILDTLGDLASVYSLASVAFIGGSLVPRGGHNPLEAARFAVPIVMGPSYENFREIVDGMIAADAIRITQPAALAQTLIDLLLDDHGLGQRAQTFFQSQSGATARTLTALLPLLQSEEKPQP